MVGLTAVQEAPGIISRVAVAADTKVKSKFLTENLMFMTMMCANKVRTVRLLLEKLLA